MKRVPFYKNIHFLFVAGGLLLNFLLAVVYQYINAGSPFIPLSGLPGFYTQGWPIMLQTFVILYFVYYVLRYFNKKYAEAPNSFQRFLHEILFVLLAGFAIMELFHWIFITYMVYPEDDMAFLERKLKMIQAIDITFLVVVYTFLTSFRIFQYLQQKQLELLQWQREYAQSQFEAVKNQLNPHFLFNSLNALSSLVYVDAGRAEMFIEKLSRSYRYLLEQKDKQLVPLQDELQFLDSFLFLMQQRFGSKLQITFHNLHPGRWQVIPHSLMIVFEYIFATNGMSAKKPLVVQITQQNNHLHIDYNQQPKVSTTDQATEQLQRLQEQYNLLQQPLLVAANKENGSIRIPLTSPS